MREEEQQQLSTASLLNENESRIVVGWLLACLMNEKRKRERERDSGKWNYWMQIFLRWTRTMWQQQDMIKVSLQSRSFVFHLSHRLRRRSNKFPRRIEATRRHPHVIIGEERKYVTLTTLRFALECLCLTFRSIRKPISAQIQDSSGAFLLAWMWRELHVCWLLLLCNTETQSTSEVEMLRQFFMLVEVEKERKFMALHFVLFWMLSQRISIFQQLPTRVSLFIQFANFHSLSSPTFSSLKSWKLLHNRERKAFNRHFWRASIESFNN